MTSFSVVPDFPAPELALSVFVAELDGFAAEELSAFDDGEEEEELSAPFPPSFAAL